MLNLKQKLMAVAMMTFIASGGVFAQKGGDRRPPKNPDKVVVQPKGEKPPPRENPRDKKKEDKRGRP